MTTEGTDGKKAGEGEAFSSEVENAISVLAMAYASRSSERLRADEQGIGVSSLYDTMRASLAAILSSGFCAIISVTELGKNGKGTYDYHIHGTANAPMLQATVEAAEELQQLALQILTKDYVIPDVLRRLGISANEGEEAGEKEKGGE
jgi:hypothetical protein